MTTGVLVMAHGTPERPDEIEAFYTRVRRGRPPSLEQLDDLRRRYDAIGGTSPLAERTAAQVRALADVLDAEPGRYEVAFGAKHTDPSIETAAATLAAGRLDGVVGLVLTPHRSSMGSGEYLSRAASAVEATAPGTAFTPVVQWWDAPGFAELLAGRVDEAVGRLGGRRTEVLFTAHSLPTRVVGEGDPYPDQLQASAAAIAALSGVGERWRVAWQSAGRTPEPWLGPDVLDVIHALPEEGVDGVVVCPVGFVADHLEVLYDLDVEARRAAEDVGITFERTASLNDDPRFIAILADVVREAAERRSG